MLSIIERLRAAEKKNRPSFEFWAVIENGEIHDDMYGIGLMNGIHSSEIESLTAEIDTYLAVSIDEFPDNATLHFLATNVFFEEAQQTFPETCALDFPPHWEMDVEIIKTELFNTAIAEQEKSC